MKIPRRWSDRCLPITDTKVLIALLANRDVATRCRAVYTLGYLRSPEAVPALLQLLKADSDELVRSEAASALGYIGEPAAIEQLVKIVVNHEENEDIRISAANALMGCEPGKREREMLFAVMSNRSEDSQLRAEVGCLLSTLNDPSIKSSLFELMEDFDGYPLYLALEASGVFIDETDIDLVPRLANILHNRHEYSDARMRAAEALGQIGNKNAVKELMKARHDPDIVVRATVEEAISEIGQGNR